MDGHNKPCCECAYYRASKYVDWCGGPHVRPDIVSGKPLMQLPGARYSGGQGLRTNVLPCGETTARHWKPRANGPSFWRRIFTLREV